MGMAARQLRRGTSRCRYHRQWLRCGRAVKRGKDYTVSLTAHSSAIIIPLGSNDQARAHIWNPKWAPAARQALLKNGYEPTPLVGKRPVLDQWQNSRPTAEDIAAWGVTHPNATNTGILTRLVPAIDDD